MTGKTGEENVLLTVDEVTAHMVGELQWKERENDLNVLFNEIIWRFKEKSEAGEMAETSSISLSKSIRDRIEELREEGNYPTTSAMIRELLFWYP